MPPKSLGESFTSRWSSRPSPDARASLLPMDSRPPSAGWPDHQCLGPQGDGGRRTDRVERAEDDPFTIDLIMPKKTQARSQVKFDLLLAAGSEGGAAFMTVASQKVLTLNWNDVVFYPKSATALETPYQAAVTVPAGWKYGTAHCHCAKAVGSPFAKSLSGRLSIHRFSPAPRPQGATRRTPSRRDGLRQHRWARSPGGDYRGLEAAAGRGRSDCSVLIARTNATRFCWG